MLNAFLYYQILFTCIFIFKTELFNYFFNAIDKFYLYLKLACSVINTKLVLMRKCLEIFCNSKWAKRQVWFYCKELNLWRFFLNMPFSSQQCYSMLYTLFMLQNFIYIIKKIL